MSRYLVITFFYLSNICFGQVKYGNDLKSLLKENKINDEQQLLILSVNSNDCINCIFPIGNLFTQIKKLEIQNVLYLIDGIDISEKEKYFKNVLHLDTLGKKIITDKKIYSAINPSSDSKIYVVKKGKILYSAKIKDFGDGQELATLFKSPMRYPCLMDSSIIDSRFLNLGVYASDMIDSSTLVTLNTKYQEINCIDIIQNRVIKTVTNSTLKLNVDSLIKIMISQHSDSLLLAYNLWVRKQPINFFTKNPIYPQVDLMNLSVQDSSILLTVGIPILTPSFKDRDTFFMISKVPFIVLLSKILKNKGIFLFDNNESKLPKNYSASLFVPMFYDANSMSFFMKTSYYGDNKNFKEVKSIMNCVVQDTRIKFNKLLPLQFPNFFLEKGYFNNYNNCAFVPIRNKLFFYFNFVPTILQLARF